MFDPRVVLGRAVLTLALLTGAGVDSRGAGETIRFLEPTEGALVIGPGTMRFAVEDHRPPVDRIDVYIEKRLIGAAYPPEWVLDWREELTLRGEVLYAIGYAGDAIVDRTNVKAKDFGGVQHVNVALVQLYPVVRDSQDRYIRDLTREDFVVFENGREVPIKHCANEVQSLNIALLLDISRSMQPKLGRVQDASIQFAERLGESDALALYAFNHRVHRIVPLTLDHASVRESIWYLGASGGTALYDGLLEVLEDVGKVPGRKAVVVFSDGQDKLSLTSLSRVAREATRHEVIIYAVGAGGGGSTAREDLTLLATRSGGKAYFIERPRELPEAYRQIQLHLKSQYLLSYVPPPGPEELRRIEVKVRGRGYDVRCRTSYHFISGE